MTGDRRAGRRDPDGALGTRQPAEADRQFLFSGPTGVGKTEVARHSRVCLGIELIRFDIGVHGATRCHG
jgi:ATP-dependent Clp protease ATP-binding subunit ClpA